METKIFREYDIRGTYPTDLNEETFYTLGKSYGSYIQSNYSQKKCVVSRDNRLSSEALATNFIKGVLETGCDVLDCGLTTTPMNFYARYLNQLYGAMITASHNPKDDNGLKFSFGGPTNAAGDEIVNFKNFTLAGSFLTGTGKLEEANITDKYIDYMKKGVTFGPRKRKVVIDCGNGATTVIARKVFSQFNIDFEIINEENDGRFPNHHPDPAVKKNLEQLKDAVLKHKADLGIAYDGDGDRTGFVKDNGEFMSIEEFMILMARDILPTATNKTILYDVKCSKILEEEITNAGGIPFMYRTGASYTQNKAHADNISFGGEFSGHIFFRDKVADIGSGIYASLRLCELLSKTEGTLSNITSTIKKYPITEEIKIKARDEYKFVIVENIKEYANKHGFKYSDIDGIKIFFDRGWVLIRASNTGPNLIFRAEADTEADKETLYNYFSEIIKTYNK